MATVALCSLVPALSCFAGAEARTGFHAIMPVSPHGRSPSGWMTPQARSAKDLLYVASGGAQTVDVFSVSGSQITLVGQIMNFNDPQGMATDAQGNLYVVDDYIPQEGPAAGQLDVFPKGATSPSRIIPTYPLTPFDVAVDKHGIIYISNIAPVGRLSPGKVTVYGKKSDVHPIRVLRDPASSQGWGITLDSATSDVYVSYALGSTGRIVRFSGGRGKPVDLGVAFGNPWGLKNDGSGNLLASDGSSGNIDIFPEAGGSLVGTIAVPGAPLLSTFNTTHSLLYVSNFNNHDVEVFSYPSKAMVGSITRSEWGPTSWPTGVAYWPPAP
ncbi:MAG: hypothetical protein JO043_07505 [Candidatus Eremiobacteraeota bacterium]|nr:hypothetical protein [Candidatus Eremiobacteraeota bacterium]